MEKLSLVKDYVNNLAEATKNNQIKPIIVKQNGDWDYYLQEYYTRDELVKYFGDYPYDYTMFEKDYVGDGKDLYKDFVLTIYIDDAFYENNKIFVDIQRAKKLRKTNFEVFQNEQGEIVGVKNKAMHYVAFNREKVLATKNEDVIEKLFANENLSFNPYGIVEELYDIINKRAFTYGKWRDLSEDELERYTEKCGALYTQKSFNVRGIYHYENNSCYSMD